MLVGIGVDLCWYPLRELVVKCWPNLLEHLVWFCPSSFIYFMVAWFDIQSMAHAGDWVDGLAFTIMAPCLWFDHFFFVKDISYFLIRTSIELWKYSEKKEGQGYKAPDLELTVFEMDLDG